MLLLHAVMQRDCRLWAKIDNSVMLVWLASHFSSNAFNWLSHLCIYFSDLIHGSGVTFSPQ